MAHNEGGTVRPRLLPAASGLAVAVVAALFLTPPQFTALVLGGAFLSAIAYMSRSLAPGRATVGGVPAEHSGAPSLVRPLAECSTSDVAAAWTASHELLRITSSPAARARVAALRQKYLDELEHRDRSALERWLASEPEPAGDPARFFRDRSGDR